MTIEKGGNQIVYKMSVFTGHMAKADATSIAPPVAKQEIKKTEIHGMVLEDPYFWLRNKETDDVIQYLKEENKYAEKIMEDTKEFQEKLYLEMKGRIKETDESVPIKIDDYYYYTRTEEGKNYVIHCRKHGSLDALEEIYFDENKYAEGHEYFRLGSLRISPDHKLMAYTIDTNGYETYDLYIAEIATEEIRGKIPEVAGNTEWDNNSTHLFYIILDKIHRPYAIKLHRLGDDPGTDKIVFEEPDEEFLVTMTKTKDDKYFFVSSLASDTTEVRYSLLAQKGEDKSPLLHDLKPFIPRKEGIEYQLAHHEGFFYVTINENAVNFKIMRTRVEDTDPNNWEEFIPHDPNVRLFGVDTFKNFLAILKRENGFMGITIHNVHTGEAHDIEMPEPIYALGFMSNPNYDSEKIRFRFSSPVTPPITFEYDMAKKQLENLKQDEIKGFDPSQYMTVREFAVAEDGTKIPISIAFKKGIEKDGTNPTLLYGYGSYGISVDPSFSSTAISLLERGMIYAIAHIRGGGELGKPWYEDGKLKKKMNTFTDFIAVAEHLIQNRYTSPNHLAIMGGSAGGLLMGAVTNMRPDLFKCVVARVPFVDVINTMLDASIPLTTFEYKEWGNPNEKDYFDYMMSYSPYDNIKQQDYPHILVTAGLNDPRVHYWEPAKFVAKLRAMKTDHNMLLLKTNMGAGHAGASGRYDYLRELAYIYAFILKALGLSLR